MFGGPPTAYKDYKPPKGGGYDMLTISTQNGGWVRYENFPIYRNGHRLNPVYHGGIHVLTGFWHCIHCKLMGTETTMKQYHCLV